MPRAAWKGSVSFGLVNIPVALYSAVKDKSVSFHLVHREDKAPIKYKRWCPQHEREVDWKEIDYGYPITKEKMVVFRKEELQALQLKTTRAIEIQGFVDLMAIDPIFYASHFFLAPLEGGEKAYELLRQALSVGGKAAVGKVVMHNKEHVVTIRPYRKGLLMNTLNYADEILDIDQLEELAKPPEVADKERKLAVSLVQGMSGEFKPGEYEDTYRQAVMQMVRQRAEGAVIPVAKPAEVKATVDIMKALEESVRAVKQKKPAAAK